VVKKAVGSFMKVVHAEPIGMENEFLTKDGGGDIGNLVGSAKFCILDPLRVMKLFKNIKKSVSFEYSLALLNLHSFRTFHC
jgi:hypothetical protein